MKRSFCCVALALTLVAPHLLAQRRTSSASPSVSDSSQHVVKGLLKVADGADLTAIPLWSKPLSEAQVCGVPDIDRSRIPKRHELGAVSVVARSGACSSVRPGDHVFVLAFPTRQLERCTIIQLDCVVLCLSVPYDSAGIQMRTATLLIPDSDVGKSFSEEEIGPFHLVPQLKRVP